MYFRELQRNHLSYIQCKTIGVKRMPVPIFEGVHKEQPGIHKPGEACIS